MAASEPERLTRLEVEFEHVRRDLDEIRADQKEIRTALVRIEQALAARPTRTQFWIMIALSAVLVLTVLGFVIAGTAALVAGFGALITEFANGISA